MGIDLLALPIVAPAGPHAEADERRAADWVRDRIIEEGRTARRFNRPNRPPPYRNKDFAIDWSNGWRWEDEERKARKARKDHA